MKSTVCIVEDRPNFEQSLKLLLLSLTVHSPGLTINLFYPPAGPEFFQWAEGHPHVRVQTWRPKGPGWDVKPEAALSLLGEGFEEVIWIDSDVIVCSDAVAPFRELTKETFATTVDIPAAQRNGTGADRARSWGFEVRRELTFNPNLGVFRATSGHQRLLERWAELLASPDYMACQQMEWNARPFHMMGDHDPLAALLCSAEFADVPVHFLRSGADVLHFCGVTGYPLAPRMRHLLFGPPTFVHSMGIKPWAHRWADASPGLLGWLEDKYLDLSPYTLYAARLGRDAGLHCEWMEPHSGVGRALRVLGAGSPPLTGLPIAVLADFSRLVTSVRGLISARSRRVSQ
jgi:hypothetical protein